MVETLSERRKRAWMTRRARYGQSGHSPAAYSTMLGKPTSRARDRDASLAEDAKRLSGEAVAARPEGIAQ